MWQGKAPKGAQVDPRNTPADRDFHAGKMPNVTRVMRDDAGNLVGVQPTSFSQRLGADENFEGMAAKIRFANDPKPAPEASKPPVAATPTAETNYRQQVGEMVKCLGAEKAAQYVAKGYTVGEALEAELQSQTAERDRLSRAVATKAATDQERARQDVLTAELQKQRTELEQLRGVANGETPKRKGFAGKLRFGGSFDVFGKHQQRGNK